MLEGLQNQWHIGGFGQVLPSAEFYGGNGGADAGVTGQHDDFGIGKALAQLGQPTQAAVAIEVEVENNAFRLAGVRGKLGLCGDPVQMQRMTGKTALQQSGEGFVVVNQ